MSYLKMFPLKPQAWFWKWPPRKNCQPSLTGDKTTIPKVKLFGVFCSVYNSDPVDDGEWIFVTEVSQTHWEKWEGQEEEMWVILQWTLFGTLVDHVKIKLVVQRYVQNHLPLIYTINYIT